MKRVLLLVLVVLLCAAPAMAEEEAQGPMPRALYTGRVTQNIAIRTEMSREAESVGNLRVDETARILAYEPGWLLVVDGTDDAWVTGYVLRHTVHDVKATEEAELPYGASPAAYTATLTTDVLLHAAPDTGSELIMLMQKGTRLALLSISDGWGHMIYHRQDAYVYLDAIEDLTPVYDAASAMPGDTLAAYVSFYNLSEKGLNPNRMLNIDVACEYISLTLSPGEDFSFNGIAGPYRKTRGYFEAPAFVGGETVASYGGGTCQVSSTLYNTLLPISDSMTILYRVAHGPGGAAYLPHGVDAACGNEGIDLCFRNDYDFPVKIVAEAHHGVLYIALVHEG